jgi:GNAT superfamily N-acetyltransferase
MSSSAKSKPDGVPEVRLREACGRDAPTLVAIVLEGFETYRSFAPDGWQPPNIAVADQRARLQDAGTWSMLAEVDGRDVAGHVAFMPARRHFLPSPDPSVAHLWQLFVRSAFWGTGLASRLLSAAAAEAVSRGYTSMRLFVPVGQARARRFYEREEFLPAGAPFEDERMAGLPLVEYLRSLSVT